MGQFAFRANRPGVREHDVLGDGQAQPSTSGFARTRFIDPIETFKKARQMFRGNAGAEVLHKKFNQVGNRPCP